MSRSGIEPYKIKMVEHIGFTTREQREDIIKKAKHNVFNIPSKDVTIDLLTDSGTSAMSDYQWSGLMYGDEAYAGSRNFYNFEAAVQEIFNYKYVIPTHQGRGAEKVWQSALDLKQGYYVCGNMIFPDTRAMMEYNGSTPMEFLIDEGIDTQVDHPFKGNLDTDRLEQFIKKVGPEKIRQIVLMVTNNNNGGQPVSMSNIKATSKLARKYGIMLTFDATRFSENCYFIKQREPGYEDKSILEIANEMFSYGDAATVSAKKCALTNIGGFIALNDRDLYEKCQEFSVLFEGFPTYGGLAGRDLEALARGLKEGIEESYLAERVGQVEFLNDLLEQVGAFVVKPHGGHAAYIDVKKTLPEIPIEQFREIALSLAIYIDSGVRTAGFGMLMFGRKKDPYTGEQLIPSTELLRLAIPRRVYTDRHLTYVAESVERVLKNRDQIKGLRLVKESKRLRFFLSILEPII